MSFQVFCPFLFLFFFNLNFFFKKLIFYFWLRWVFVAARSLSLVVVSRGYSVVVCRLLIVVASLL